MVSRAPSLDGAGRLPQDLKNGCGLAIAEDIVETVQGVDGTVAIAGGTAADGLGLPGIASAGERSASIGSLSDVYDDPQSLAGKTPAQVESAIGNTPGWQVETLGKGTQVGNGWVLRQYTDSGNPTGLQIRWNPGGGHHGPDPYWRVVGPNGDIGGIIR